MSDTNYPCGKCGSEMGMGFLVDRTDNSDYVLRWVEGEPVHPNLLGMTLKSVATQGRQDLGVRSLRCKRCGFFELYAV